MNNMAEYLVTIELRGGARVRMKMWAENALVAKAAAALMIGYNALVISAWREE